VKLRPARVGPRIVRRRARSVALAAKAGRFCRSRATPPTVLPEAGAVTRKRSPLVLSAGLGRRPFNRKPFFSLAIS